MPRRSLSPLQIAMMATGIAWVLRWTVFAADRWWNLVMAGLLMIVLALVLLQDRPPRS